MLLREIILYWVPKLGAILLILYKLKVFLTKLYTFCPLIRYKYEGNENTMKKIWEETNDEKI